MDRRLRKIAEMIPLSCRTLADIGTDHGYLPAELILHHGLDRAVAADVSAGSLQKAAEEVKRRNLESRIQLRLGDGLSVLHPEEKIDAVVIAGMGGLLIGQILEKGRPWIERHRPVFLLQPVQGPELLSVWLQTSGFDLVEEALVQEKDKIYRIMKAIYTGQPREASPLWDHEIGLLLCQRKDPLFMEYMDRKIQELQSILQDLEGKDTPKALEKRQELKAKRRYFQKKLTCEASKSNDENPLCKE